MQLGASPFRIFSRPQGVCDIPPMLLVTNHVIEFSRLSWPNHDAMIRVGIMIHDPQPARTRSPFPKPVMA